MAEDDSGGALAETAPGQSRTIIVGIGASAGGIKALQQFFEALPRGIGAAFVVIAHLDPEYRSELPAILSAHSNMPVEQVTGKSELHADRIYVIPPDRQLQISDSHIAAIPFAEPRGRRMPIDFFFRSLAEQNGDGFAIVLSGAGSDGAIGVRAIKENGGLVLVQDPEQAEYATMPRAAIATEVADFVLPVAELAQRLAELVRTKKQSFDLATNDYEDERLLRILAHLRTRTGHDFSHYKRSTVLRRVARRMQVTRQNDLGDYFAYLRENADEVQMLLADLLISVTTFFRGNSAFEGLAKKTIPQLFSHRTASSSIRVWVVGCATGEEAYSIAMLLLEESARQDVHPEIQIFATDMDSRALAIAREGLYPVAIEADVSEERLRRFFQRDGDHYRVKRELRDMVLFASHSLLKDPPFSRVDLISCRNLLIYLDRDLQQQVLTTFNYALNRHGYLFLGSSENADSPDHLFRVVDREARIYQSSGRVEKPPMLPRLLGIAPVTGRLAGAPAPPAIRPARVLHREVLEASGPPSILVDRSSQILHLSESAGRYLQPPGGTLSSDVTELVREEIRFELRAALHRTFEQRETTLSPLLMVKFNGAPHRLYFQVKPVGSSEQEGEQALILFIEGEAVIDAAATETVEAGQTPAGETIRHLHQELDIAHSRLRGMREESEAANEELRAANEELQSINEEYRSTAEELETSKEEIQSINEELQTVNNELKVKLDTVSRANSDLQNLIVATDFGVLFLDAGLRIKLFTPRTTELFNIAHSDIGRPITDFTHLLADHDLAEDVRVVLKDLVPLESEVHSQNDGWYLVRLRPYRTVEDKIDGVVATFVDITQRKASEARLKLLLSELTHRVKNVLAVVQGMAHQTARNSASKEDFVARLDGRLLALAASHKLLVDSDWQGADLQKLIRTELEPYAGDLSRLRLQGESVSLPADVATVFGLVLHELATNAMKYGALSKDDGCLELEWQVQPGKKGPQLDFRWREKDGPPVKSPLTHGFGSNLIQNGLPGAKTQLDFNPDGLECNIVVPMRPAG